MQNKNFRYIDDWAFIRLADSFVKVNKAGTGNGEAALYLGSKKDPDIFRFFTAEDFDVHCLIAKSEILEYMDEVKCEYEHNRFLYRKKVDIESWIQNVEVISKLPDDLFFDLTRKRQFDKTGRVYAQELTYKRSSNLSIDSNHKAYVYSLIRTIAIPEVSFLMLSKLEGVDNIDFYAKLHYDPNFE